MPTEFEIEVGLSNGDVAVVPFSVEDGAPIPSDQELQKYAVDFLNGQTGDNSQAITNTSPEESAAPSFLKSAATGLVRGGILGTAGLFDLVDSATGSVPASGKTNVQATEDFLTNLGLGADATATQQIAEYASPTSLTKVPQQMLLGALSGGASEITGALIDNPYAKMAAGLLTQIAAPRAVKGIKNRLSPEFQGNKLTKEIVEEVQNVVPTALSTQGDEIPTKLSNSRRLIDSIKRKETSNKVQLEGEFDKVLGKDLPKENQIWVPTDDLSTRLEKIAKDEILPVEIKSKISNTIEGFSGKPMISAIEEVPVLGDDGVTVLSKETRKSPLDVQDVVDTEKGRLMSFAGIAKKRSEISEMMFKEKNKNIKRVLRQLDDEFVNYLGKYIEPETLSAWENVRDQWFNFRKTYNRGKLGKAIAEDGSVEKLANIFTNDLKETKKVLSIASDQDKKMVKDIMLADIFKYEPKTWHRKISEKKEYFDEVFGTESTDDLMKIFGPQGTVGRKLLADNNGLGSLLSKNALTKVGFGFLGSLVGTGPVEQIIGAVSGVAAASGKIQVEGKARSNALALIKTLSAGASNKRTQELREILLKDYNPKNYNQDIKEASILLGKIQADTEEDENE